MLTVIVLSHNNKAALQRLLPSLRFADHTVVIDDYSTDGSEVLARRLGAAVWRRKLDGDFAAQRNFGLSKVQRGWVLFVDADEVVTEDLASEITRTIRNKDGHDGYSIERRDIFLGKRLNYGETGQMRLVRLGKVGSGVWKRKVHEVWEVADSGRLAIPLLHQSHRTIGSFLTKINQYTEIEAKLRIAAHEPLILSRLFTYPVGKFLRTYIWQQGWRDGWRGLLMSLLMSWHSFLVRGKTMWKRLAPVASMRLSARLVIWCTLLTLILLPWGQVNRIQISNSISIYLFEVVMALTIGFWLVDWMVSKRNVFRPAWVGAFGVLSAVLLLSLVSQWQHVSAEVLLFSSAYWWRWVLYGLVGWVYYDITRQGWWRISWLGVLLRLGIAWALIGWLQYLVMPDMRWIYYFGFDRHYYRLIGSLLDPSFLGVLLALTLTLFLYKKQRAYGWMMVLFGAVLLTYARSVYVILALLFLFYGWQKRRWKEASVWLAAFGIGLWFLPHPGGEGVNLSRTYSITSRTSSSVSAFTLFLNHPVLGVGFNTYKYAVGMEKNRLGVPVLASSPDNSWLLILSTSGLMGLTAFGWWSWRVFTMAREIPGGAVAWFLLLVHSMTNNTLFYPFVLVWLYLLLASVGQSQKLNTDITLH